VDKSTSRGASHASLMFVYPPPHADTRNNVLTFLIIDHGDPTSQSFQGAATEIPRPLGYLSPALSNTIVVLIMKVALLLLVVLNALTVGLRFYLSNYT
jgi:hypothetical protein